MKIKRIYFNGLWKEITEPEISILLGARQVGKSTLLRQLQARAEQEGKITAFFDLEQPSDLTQLSGSEQDVIHQITNKTQVVFIDEFHYLKNASKIFKAIFDQHKPIKIYASGSSSLSIHTHLKESLAGRFKKTIIYPLNIAEWAEVAGFDTDQYLQWGGMPGLIHRSTNEDRMGLLENIVSTYITKDIKGLIKEENIRSFNSLLYLLAQSQGSMAAVSSLARETGLKETTLARHLEIISQTYVLHVVPSFSQNLANELKKSKKYYLFDIGIRNILLKDFRKPRERPDKGSLYETAVLLHLQAQLKPNMELRFWRTKKGDEVDFILLKNRIPYPLEVKSNLSAMEIPSGLLKFLKRYPAAPLGIVFSEKFEAKTMVENRPVYFKKWPDVLNLDFVKTVI